MVKRFQRFVVSTALRLSRTRAIAPYVPALVALWKRRNQVAAGDRARDSGDWNAAAAHYRRGLERNPALAHIWVQYGHALKAGPGDLAGAERAYRRSLALRPDIADTHLQLGLCLKQQGRSQEARSAFLEALRRDPKMKQATGELLRLGLSRHQIDHLVRDLQAPVPGTSSDAAVAARPLWQPALLLDLTALAPVLHGVRLPTPLEATALRLAGTLAAEPERAIRSVLFDEAARRWRGVAVPPEAAGPAVAEIVTLPADVVLIGLGPMAERCETYFIAIRTMVVAGGCFRPWILDQSGWEAGGWDSSGWHDPEAGAQEAMAARWLAEAMALADHALLGAAAFEPRLAAWLGASGLMMPAASVVPVIGIAAPPGPAPETEQAPAERPVVLFAAGDEDDMLAILRVWEALAAETGGPGLPPLRIIARADAVAGQSPRVAAMLARCAGRAVLLHAAAEQCDALLRSALFSIHPTADGSGLISLMRAMTCGHAVIVGHDPAFFSLAGGAAEYVDFAHEEEIRARCTLLLRDDTARRRRAADVLRHARNLPNPQDSMRDLGARLRSAPVIPPAKPPAPERRLLSSVFYCFAAQAPDAGGITESGAPFLVGHAWTRIDQHGAWTLSEDAAIACRLDGWRDGLDDWCDDAYCLRLLLLAPQPGSVSVTARDGDGRILGQRTAPIEGGMTWCWLMVPVTFPGLGRDLQLEIGPHGDAALAVCGLFIHLAENLDPWFEFLDHIAYGRVPLLRTRPMSCVAKQGQGSAPMAPWDPPRGEPLGSHDV